MTTSTREMLQVLVLTTFWISLALCGNITLEKFPNPAILSLPFKFFCRVNGGTEKGQTFFQTKKNDGTYAPVCRVDVATGNQITNNSSYLCSREGKDLPWSYSLTIRKVSKRDRSQWMCQSGGMQSNTIHLDVKSNCYVLPLMVPSIIPDPPSLEIRPVQPCKGYTFFLNEKEAALNCSVTAANPFPSNFTWHHDGKIVGRDQIYTIPTVYKSSSGLYRCVADNGIFPPGEGNVTVKVHSPPVVHVDETHSVVNVSGDLTVHCKADAYPEVTSVVWTKGGVGGRISENGTLDLKNIRKVDAGDYVCTATNKVTTCSGTRQNKRSSATLKLVVQHAPDILSFDVTSGEESVTVSEHDNVTLRCQVRSNPASVTEIRNGTSIIGRENINDTLEARIDDVGCLQTGPYTCSARNVLGKAAAESISLQVKCAPRSRGSTTDRYEFRSVLRGNVTLHLTVIAFPVPKFKWSRGRTSSLSNSKVIPDGALVNGSVTIFDVKETDFGNYTATVSNTEGTIRINVMLMSASKPDTPTNLQASSISTGSFTLTWEKSSNGGAKQRFNIQYRQPGGQWTTHPTSPTEDDILRLDIDGVEPGTVYEVQINAQNIYGASDYTDIIVVETESVDNGVIAAIVVAVAVALLVAILITVTVFLVKKRAQSDANGDKRQEVEEIVMEDNLLYESSGDLQRPLVVEHGDLYTDINSISKTNYPAVEDLYAKPQKQTKPDKIKVQTDPAEVVYAKPQKEKGKPNDPVTEEKAGAMLPNHDPEAVYTNTGANVL